MDLNSLIAENAHWLTIVAISVCAALITGLVVYLRAQKRIAGLQDQNTALQVTLEMERKAAQEKQTATDAARTQLSETFSALSSQALKHNTEEFLKLAQENLKQYQLKAHSELSEKEKAIENLVKPIKDTLEKTEKQIRLMEHERKEAYGALTQHLHSMAQTQQALQGETRNLVKALSRPEVRGQWGELTLRRLAELAGMVEHCDFFEQEHTQTETGAQRPDMIVRMPGSREIVVDVKTPLDAYLRAIEAVDDETKTRELEKHTKNIRERIRELATKAYWNQFKHSPEFVVLFIPGDQFLSSALDQDHNLLENAMQQKIILATPTSLVALLRAIAYGWRQEALTENAEQIRQIGDELYGRLSTFAEHLNKLGRSLAGSVQHFNKAVGSFDSRILPSAKKFSEMGISANKEVGRVEQLETTTRSLESQLDKKPEPRPEMEKETDDAVY
ncbi:MAG: DNA recombination protein RmuC [Gammaproteobacteria bacterium]|jgi:DNA recombination protein RmuC